MAETWKRNAMTEVPSDTILFEAGEEADGIFALVKGGVKLATEQVGLTAGKGDFLSLLGLLSGKRRMTGTAVLETAFVVLPTKDLSELTELLDNNKEYGGRMLHSLLSLYGELRRVGSDYRKEADRLPAMLRECYRQYLALCLQEGLRNEDLSERFLPPLKKREMAEWEEYYTELSQMSEDKQTAFFSGGSVVAKRHLTELLPMLEEALNSVEELGAYIRKLGAVLINRGSDNLFFALVTLKETAKKPETKKSAGLLCDMIEKKLSDLTALFAASGAKPFLSYPERREARVRMEELHEAEEPCEDSFETLLSYGGATEELRNNFTSAMQQFKNLIDVTSSDDDIRKLRRELAGYFYELYEKIFLKAYGKGKKELSVPVRLFLDFGFLDETLVSRTRLLELERLSIEPLGQGAQVYTMREWLTLVYEGKKEPSKNEFDQEYAEMLREQRKTGRITEEEELRLGKSKSERLHYEITNLFRYNHRLVNGQLSIFVPFLCEDLLMGGATATFLTKKQVEDELRRINDIDYSLFTREFLYRSKEHGIEKEYFVKDVFPDVILFPTAGQKSIMWQDISCRRRDTPARFLLPIFAEVSIEELLVRTCGRYRWEHCRTTQGVAWNNVQVKSLTSEYSDYLMYYKKNYDISEEKKERIKLQLQKAKNNYREVFAMDYETFVKYESSGAMKLNKVSRELLATYCPFHASIRKKLVAQPSFADAYARQTRERLHKIHELELRYHAIEKNGVTLPKELTDTMLFYKEG